MLHNSASGVARVDQFPSIARVGSDLVTPLNIAILPSLGSIAPLFNCLTSTVNRTNVKTNISTKEYFERNILATLSTLPLILLPKIKEGKNSKKKESEMT